MTELGYEYLRSVAIGLGATNVVIGSLPSLETNAVAIRPVDGYRSTFYFGQASTDEPLVEVIIRNKDYASGQALYMALKDGMNQLRNEEAGVDSCILTGSPGHLGSDQTGWHEWHMLFHITSF